MKRQVHSENLGILEPKFDEAIQCKSLLIALFGCKHGFVDLLLLGLVELSLRYDGNTAGCLTEFSRYLRH